MTVEIISMLCMKCQKLRALRIENCTPDDCVCAEPRFYDSGRLGAVSHYNSIEAKVAAWHDDPNIKGSLAQYLGMTDEEYAAWVEKPSTYIPKPISEENMRKGREALAKLGTMSAATSSKASDAERPKYSLAQANEDYKRSGNLERDQAAIEHSNQILRALCGELPDAEIEAAAEAFRKSDPVGTAHRWDLIHHVFEAGYRACLAKSAEPIALDERTLRRLSGLRIDRLLTLPRGELIECIAFWKETADMHFLAPPIEWPSEDEWAEHMDKKIGGYDYHARLLCRWLKARLEKGK